MRKGIVMSMPFRLLLYGNPVPLPRGGSRNRHLMNSDVHQLLRQALLPLPIESVGLCLPVLLVPGRQFDLEPVCSMQELPPATSAQLHHAGVQRDQVMTDLSFF